MNRPRQFAARLKRLGVGAVVLLAPAVTLVAQPTRPAFSEDFESGVLNLKTWTSDVTGRNVIEVQRETVAHGNFALRVHCPEPSTRTWAFIIASHVPESLRKHHYGRAYMYVAPKAPERHTVLITAGTRGFPSAKFQEIATTFGRWQLTYVDLRPDGDKEDYHIGESAVPLGKWFCLEWEFNDEPNRVAISIDGKPVYETGFISKATGATSGLIGGFVEFALGFRLWGAAPEAFAIYYDDVALDTRPLGQITGTSGKK